MLPAQPPGQHLPQIRERVIAASPLPDHRHRLPAHGRARREVPDGDRDSRVQVGTTVVADRAGPVAADGGNVGVEVAVPAAPRAVILNPLRQPVPLHRPGRVVRARDHPRDPVPAGLVVGGLVGGQPRAAGGVAVLDMDRAACGARKYGSGYPAGS
jgi:hypothetical protein